MNTKTDGERLLPCFRVRIRLEDSRGEQIDVAEETVTAEDEIEAKAQALKKWQCSPEMMQDGLRITTEVRPLKYFSLIEMSCTVRRIFIPAESKDEAQEIADSSTQEELAQYPSELIAVFYHVDEDDQEQ